MSAFCGEGKLAKRFRGEGVGGAVGCGCPPWGTQGCTVSPCCVVTWRRLRELSGVPLERAPLPSCGPSTQPPRRGPASWHHCPRAGVSTCEFGGPQTFRPRRWWRLLTLPVPVSHLWMGGLSPPRAAVRIRDLTRANRAAPRLTADPAFIFCRSWTETLNRNLGRRE